MGFNLSLKMTAAVNSRPDNWSLVLDRSTSTPSQVGLTLTWNSRNDLSLFSRAGRTERSSQRRMITVTDSKAVECHRYTAAGTKELLVSKENAFCYRKPVEPLH